MSGGRLGLESANCHVRGEKGASTSTQGGWQEVVILLAAGWLTPAA